MGLNTNSLKFLLLAHAHGVSFKHVLMIGRQSLGVTAADIRGLVTLPCSASLKEGLRRLTLGSDVYAEDFFRLCGAEQVDSLDKTAYEGATVLHDLNVPVPDMMFDRYDLIVDGGSIEHVFNVPVAFRNYMKMLRVGGHYVCNTATNNYSGHGFYQLSPELFFAVFAPNNGFRMRWLYLYEEDGRNRWYRLSQPADASRRLTFQNKVPTHLLVLAQKTVEANVFEPVPQQNMYHAAWKKGGVGPVVGRPGMKRRLFRWLEHAPARIKWLVLNEWNTRNRFRKDLFSRVGDQESSPRNDS